MRRPLEAAVESMPDYGEALDALSARDRALVETRVKDRTAYEDIAGRFRFPGADAARMAVSRVLQRLLDRFGHKRHH
jgi:hypothetical protein